MGQNLCARMGGFLTIKEDVETLVKTVELLEGLNKKIEYGHSMLNSTVKTLEDAK
jgi:hypothetical protein